MIIHRVRVYPGICGSTDTIIDCYIDKILDIACHPLYGRRESGQQGGAEDRPRHRSVPVHRLRQEMASNLQLEPDSVIEEPGLARGTAPSRNVMPLESTMQQFDDLNNASFNVSL